MSAIPPRRCAPALGVLLPAASKRLIELHKALIFVTPRLRQSELGIVERALTIEDLEIGGDASPVARKREVYRVLQVVDSFSLANPHLMIFLISDQGIGDITEGPLDGLLVSNQGLLVLRLS